MNTFKYHRNLHTSDKVLHLFKNTVAHAESVCILSFSGDGNSRWSNGFGDSNKAWTPYSGNESLHMSSIELAASVLERVSNGEPLIHVRKAKLLQGLHPATIWRYAMGRGPLPLPCLVRGSRRYTTDAIVGEWLLACMAKKAERGESNSADAEAAMAFMTQ